MADLLTQSARIVDTGTFDPGFNPMAAELHELADGVAMVDAFSHVVALDGGDGLVLFDVSHAMFGPRVVEALRAWRTDPVHTIVYTHGHLDHVGGAAAVIADNEGRGPRPAVVAHANVPVRFDRYVRTAGHNAAINARQFGGSAIDRGAISGLAEQWLTGLGVRPTTTYTDQLRLHVGDLVLDLHHGRGETDDHTWAWDAQRRAAIVGDFVIWTFPNAGNPQKVQHYPLEWAATLRRIAAAGPELLLPAHGLPLAGASRIELVLGDMATALEQLAGDTLALMNDGATLDEVLGTVRLDPELADRPWLAPIYDEPEFVVRNTWRLYGGWYDGNPANLKPARTSALALEVARLAGGTDALVDRARDLVAAGELALGCHLVELAVAAAPDDAAAHEARAAIYGERRTRETSLMAKGIFGDASRTSAARAAELRDDDRPTPDHQERRP
ncbi:MAG: MBL fold metallo-hydrolase [Acidimicrobiales bacterium]|nr:MBL fold metallo-hydrolase [Acidimicrobiales bacterium]